MDAQQQQPEPDQLRSAAMSAVAGSTFGRSRAQHIAIVWANFRDAFANRADFDQAVARKLWVRGINGFQ